MGLTHQPGQLFINDLDDLLARGQTLQDVDTHGTLADLFNQLFDDLVIDIRLKQGQADLLEGFFDVFFTQPSTPGQSFESGIQFFR